MADCIKTTPEWVQLITPKRLGNRLVVVGSWVVDFDDGYGPCFGRVVGLTGRHELDVEWADGGKESIHRKNARLVPCVGSTWTHDGNKYILKRYSEKGAHLNFLGGLDALTPRRRSRRTRTSETSKAKSKTSKVKRKKRAASQDKSKNESSAAKPRRSKRKSKRRSTPSPTKSPAKKTARKGKSPAKSPAKKRRENGNRGGNYRLLPSQIHAKILTPTGLQLRLAQNKKRTSGIGRIQNTRGKNISRRLGCRGRCTTPSSKKSCTQLG